MSTLAVAAALREAAEHHAAASRALARAADELETIEPSAGPYTSTNLPPDCPSRDRFRRLAKTIATAHGPSSSWKAGNVWLVTRAAWAEHRTVAPTADPYTAPMEHDDMEAIRHAGLRVVGGK